MRNRLSLFSNYVRELNARALDCDVETFVGRSVASLSEILGFDCAWYGWAEIDETSVEIHASATRNLPDNYFEFWTGIAAEDMLAADIRANPARVATYDRRGEAQTDGMQALADTFGLRRMATAMRLRDGRAASLFVSAYRGGNRARPWTGEEREFLQCAVDHMSASARVATARRGDAAEDEGAASIFISETGVGIVGLQTMRERFGHVWSALDGDRVPASLCAFVDQPGEHLLIDRGLVVRCEHARSAEGFSLRKLTLRPLRKFDLLTPREQEVARSLASGLSHKESARALGVAPATIRNQTQSIYSKLGVDNRASLAAEVPRNREPALFRIG